MLKAFLSARPLVANSVEKLAVGMIFSNQQFLKTCS